MLIVIYLYIFDNKDVTSHILRKMLITDIFAHAGSMQFKVVGLKMVNRICDCELDSNWFLPRPSCNYCRAVK